MLFIKCRLSATSVYVCQKSKTQALKQVEAYLQMPERLRCPSLRSGVMENGDEYEGDRTNPRGVLSFKQIIYSAGGSGGFIWRMRGSVGLALGAKWIPTEAKGLPHYGSRSVLWQVLKCEIAQFGPDNRTYPNVGPRRTSMQYLYVIQVKEYTAH